MKRYKCNYYQLLCGCGSIVSDIGHRIHFLSNFLWLINSFSFFPELFQIQGLDCNPFSSNSPLHTITSVFILPRDIHLFVYNHFAQMQVSQILMVLPFIHFSIPNSNLSLALTYVFWTLRQHTHMGPKLTRKSNG